MSDGKGHGQRDGVLVLIAIFKLVKVALLVAIGVGAFELAGHDTGQTLTRWASHLRVDPENRLFHALLQKTAGVDAKELEELGVGTFVYAIVFAVEGVGLLLKKRWAEYMTVIVTTSFVPLEIWEMTHRPSVAKAITIALNAAIIVYLVIKLKKQRRESSRDARSTSSTGNTGNTGNTQQRGQRSSGSTHLRPSTGKS